MTIVWMICLCNVCDHSLDAIRIEKIGTVDIAFIVITTFLGAETEHKILSHFDDKPDGPAAFSSVLSA